MGSLITVTPLSANSCPPAVLLSQCGDDRLSFIEVQTQAWQCYCSLLGQFAACLSAAPDIKVT